MNIITGYRGEPHITSGQDRAQNQGTYGTGSYILDVGRKLVAEIVSANEIRIRDGVLSHQGCIANIEQGAYDSLEIANGTQGMSRIDLIVARYTKDAETNVEDVELVVIEGTAAASSPAVPSYNTGDIQAGDSPVDMPLYRVNISGVSIGSVTQVASTVRTQAETDALLGNTSIAGIGGGTLTGAVSALNSNVTGYGSNTNGEYWKFLDGTLICAKRITASMNFTTAFGNWYETPSAIQFGDWPIPFISIPVAQVTVLSRMAIAESLQYLSPTSAGSSYFARPNSVQTQDTTVHIIGIGRWK